MGKKCCLCLAREAVGVFSIKRRFKDFDGTEREGAYCFHFCAHCKDEGIRRVVMPYANSPQDFVVSPHIAEWKEFSEQENT